ncbi:MAG: exodeoxyribonuclease VII small subunit [Coriobacteriales bacterium]|jgi:exodeoxyribonuclease VII small subunit|nr:exodeoxyribonuclease VII small subunit [Coriobacteriales bacterium]
MDRQSSYARTRERLEEIVTQVKAKDISLEKSLDLYEEALRLGSTCAEMIDRTDFSAEELEIARGDEGEEEMGISTGADADENSPASPDDEPAPEAAPAPTPEEAS